MVIENFTPLPALGGGILIGAAAALLMLFNGKIAGISGITKGILAPCPTPHERLWRVAFVVGLIAGGGLMITFIPAQTALNLKMSSLQMGLGGLLVGVGTAMGNGCTSGHGVCGLARRSPRSLVSVLTFMATGFVTLFLLTQVFGIGRF
jgi:uncharacterized membrane protein YedE/YeeE